MYTAAAFDVSAPAAGLSKQMNTSHTSASWPILMISPLTLIVPELHAFFLLYLGFRIGIFPSTPYAPSKSSVSENRLSFYPNGYLRFCVSGALEALVQEVYRRTALTLNTSDLELLYFFSGE